VSNYFEQLFIFDSDARSRETLDSLRVRSSGKIRFWNIFPLERTGKNYAVAADKRQRQPANLQPHLSRRYISSLASDSKWQLPPPAAAGRPARGDLLSVIRPVYYKLTCFRRVSPPPRTRSDLPAPSPPRLPPVGWRAAFLEAAVCLLSAAAIEPNSVRVVAAERESDRCRTPPQRSRRRSSTRINSLVV